MQRGTQRNTTRFFLYLEGVPKRIDTPNRCLQNEDLDALRASVPRLTPKCDLQRVSSKLSHPEKQHEHPGVRGIPISQKYQTSFQKNTPLNKTAGVQSMGKTEWKGDIALLPRPHPQHMFRQSKTILDRAVGSRVCPHFCDTLGNLRLFTRGGSFWGAFCA